MVNIDKFVIFIYAMSIHEVLVMAAKKTVKRVSKSEFKLDMQEVLSAIDRRDRNYYKQLPDEGKRALAPSVIIRWLSAVGEPDWAEWKRQGRQKGDGKGSPPQKDSSYTDYYLLATNEGPNVNMGYYVLSKEHKELEWLLLCAVGIGKKVDHSWISTGPKSDTPSIDAMFMRKYPLASRKEIQLLKEITPSNEIIRLVKEFGNPDKLSSTEAKESRQLYGGVFDLQTIQSELKRLKKV